MNWIAILVLLGAVINDCSARNNLTVQSILEEPCDHRLSKTKFNMTRLLSPNGKEAPMFSALRQLRESIKKLPAVETGFNMTHFSTIEKAELKKAIRRTKKMKSAKKGLKAIQILLYKFYIKLDKILNITENEDERAVEGNLLALLCIFLQTGVNPTDGDMATLLHQQRNVTENEIELHRDAFKVELSDFLRHLNKGLSKLVRKVKKNVKQTKANGVKQIKKSVTNNTETDEADEDVTNGRIANRRNKTSKRKRTRDKRLSKKNKRRRERNNGRKNRKNTAKNSQNARKNKQNSRTRLRKKSQKEKKNKSD